MVDAGIDAEAKLNELDNTAGDGDCGSTLKRGADGKNNLVICIKGGKR